MKKFEPDHIRPLPLLVAHGEGAMLLPEATMTLPGIDRLGSRALQRARAGNLVIGVVPSSAPQGADTQAILDGLARYGTEAKVTGIKRLPTGEYAASVQGLRRFTLLDASIRGKRRGLNGIICYLVDKPYRRTKRLGASLRALRARALALADRAHTVIDAETRARLAAVTEPALLCDLIAPYVSLGYEGRLKLLASTDVAERLKCLIPAVEREVELLEMSRDIHEQVEAGLDESRRRNYLQEQVRVLQRELETLGCTLEDEDDEGELQQLADELDALDLPDYVREAVDRELARMEIMAAGSSEYMVSHSYLSWIKDLPWVVSGSAKAKVPPLSVARRHLAKGHYGLENVKERILEYLAVMRHRGQNRGEILLLAGPPGVGKTSLARQVAAALDRPFVAVSLGGVRDEAEIRGHRRTYIGSMPGKIMQALKQAKSAAPVVLLDEIDKVGLDHGRGAVASALLEVLDFEQNKSFVDHYLGIPYDLSNVIFIATANETAAIPGPLLDRFELVELSSYTEGEKLEIAVRHLLPAIRRDLRLTKTQFDLSAKTLTQVIRQYTREAGVRQLKRELTTMGRKAVKALLERKGRERLSHETLPRWLGQPRYIDEPNDARLTPGVAIGLAYTAIGGDILYIETNQTNQLSLADAKSVGGGARLSLTGSLGKVMRESAHAALSYLMALVHAKPGLLPITAQQIATSHIHLHLPDGATPKDGPSAGVAIMCAIASLLMDKTLSAKLAMTGEITLRGQVLAIGGLKEKLLAAHRYGKTRVIIPAANQHELASLPRDILRELEILPVRTMEEALLHAGLLAQKQATRRTRDLRTVRPAARERPRLRIAASKSRT